MGRKQDTVEKANPNEVLKVTRVIEDACPSIEKKEVKFKLSFMVLNQFYFI